jgi:amino acid transporter
VGTLVVIVLYVTINWVYFHQLSVSQVAQSLHVASDTVARLLGGSAAKYFTLAMIVSVFGSLHAAFLTGPRVPYAMARYGSFFGFAKRIQPKFHTPSGAVVFQCGVTVVLVLTGTYEDDGHLPSLPERCIVPNRNSRVVKSGFFYRTPITMAHSRLCCGQRIEPSAR